MIRLAVRVASAQAELVLAELLELAPAGVEEGAPAAGIVEYAVYGAPGELPTLPDLRAAAGDALVEIHTSEVPDDWNERWREFHRPVLIEAPGRARGESAGVPSLLVRPPWENANDALDEHMQEIVIDPGQAFGTGAHATTRMCLELLLELAAAEEARGAMLDVGTGSGVLAIAAAALGFAPVLGLDHDVESVAAARANAAVNHAAIEVRRFDLRTQELPASFPLVLANLLRPLLLELAAKLGNPPADLIAGGILADELDEVVHAFTSQTSLRERARREQGEWASVWLSAV